MNRTLTLDELNQRSKNSLIETLDITYTSLSDDEVVALMPVTSKNCQPFGMLHGGATLALAETIAGVGSVYIVNGEYPAFGMQVNGSHVASALLGDTVRAVARPMHIGKQSHVWHVCVYSEATGKLISTIHVTNSIMRNRKV